MRATDPFRRFEELQAYIGWDAADAERVHALHPLVEPFLAGLIDDFYQEIEVHPEAQAVITGGPHQIARLKKTLLNWLRELFCGNYDRDYAVRRWNVGYRHVEIGLDQVFTNAALSRLRMGLLRILEDQWRADRQALPAALRSLNALLDLDLALIQDAYATEFTLRLRQNERLVAIGQVAGGVAHELRNPLNVVKTSVYYLLNARNASSAKVAEHLQRIERQVGLADSVITTLSDFAKLAPPDRCAVPVSACIQESLPADGPPAHIQWIIDCPESLPPVLVDLKQIRIALGNVIRNAQDAMPDGGRLSVTARRHAEFVELAIVDTGVGIPPDDLRRILEPFYSTKTRGIGLGLAITRSIIQKNHGTIHVASELGRGSTFTIRLPAAPQPPDR
jgi:signal transduction histidine kinase